MAGDPSLHESAWHQVGVDAARIFRSAAFGIAVALVELVAVPVAILFTPEDAATKTQIAVPVLCGAGALALVFVVVVLVLGLVTPYRQRDRLRARVQELERAAVTSVDPQVAQEKERRRAELRVALVQMMGELEQGRAALEDENRAFFFDFKLPDGMWTNYGHQLADHGFLDEHRTTRRAYHLIDEINRSVRFDHDPVGEKTAVYIDEDKVAETVASIEEALAALESLEEPSAR